MRQLLLKIKIQKSVSSNITIKNLDHERERDLSREFDRPRDRQPLP